MGLTFSVGHPREVFVAEFAERVQSTLESNFGDCVDWSSTQPHYYSNELGWSGWQMLQQRALELLGHDEVPHFLSMEAWCGCFIPGPAPIGSFKFENAPTPLDVASLDALQNELVAIGNALGLPTDDIGLTELAEKYDDDDDDDLCDDEMDIQTYIQLLLAVHVAVRRHQVLWVVK